MTERITDENSDAVLVGVRENATVINESLRTKVVITTGHKSLAVNHSPGSLVLTTGCKSIVSSKGTDSLAAATGDNSETTSYGSWSTAISTGRKSDASARGRESIAMSIGREGKAKGLIGCWLILADRVDEYIKDVKVFYVDGEKIKANTFYQLINGKAVEVII